MNAKRIKYDQLLIVVWIFLFTFQGLLSNISAVFSYIDEAPLLLFCCISLFEKIKKGKIIIKRENRGYYIAIAIFVGVGLLGNIIYHYQTCNLIVVDLLTNLKFFGAMAFFSLLIRKHTLETKRIPNVARFLTILLTLLFVVDRTVNIFPAEYRYGIKSVVLFYGHPT